MQVLMTEKPINIRYKMLFADRKQHVCTYIVF